MIKDDDELRRIAEGELSPVNAVAMALASGLVAGLVLFVATNWLLLRGDPEPGPHLSLLSQYFFGYRVSFFGSLVGFAWAFAIAFTSVWAGALIYNKVAGGRAKDRLRGRP